MTRSDDEVLVGNEVDRCLEEAGDRLHELPSGRGSAAIPSNHVTTQHYLMRVQLLDRLGTTRAAQYLRKELLDAIADQRRDGDSATLKAMGFDPRPQTITITKPMGSNPYWTSDPNVISGGPGIMYDDLISMYEQIIAQNEWPNRSPG